MLGRMSKGGFDPYCWKTDVVLYYVYLDKDCFFSIEINCIFRLYLCSALFSIFQEKEESEIVYIKLQMGFYFSSLQYKYMLDFFLW